MLFFLQRLPLCIVTTLTVFYDTRWVLRRQGVTAQRTIQARALSLSISLSLPLSLSRSLARALSLSLSLSLSLDVMRPHQSPGRGCQMSIRPARLPGLGFRV